MNENKYLIIDLTVTIILIIIGCFVGKYFMDNISDSWIAFNGSAVGILIGGELIWFLIRKRFVK